MRGANQHLSGEEIEQLTGSATDVEVGALEGAMDHLERCELCRFRMLSVRDLSGEPPQGAGGARIGNSPCPPEARWLEVAAGLGTAAERKRYIEHAAGCARCGQLLKEAVEDVGMALTEEEKTKVATLDSAKPEWQANLAKKVADSAPPIAVPEKPVGLSGKFVFWPRWAGALAALILAAGGGWWAWIEFATPSVEALIAQSYTEKRTIEVRIPGAKYAPMRVERGPEESNLKKRPALLKAEALIAEGLQKNPNDPAWLQAKARADMLDGNYGEAIKSLQLALLSKPDSPGLLTDLGSAYFQQAEGTGRPIYYGDAAEELGKALSKAPDDPVALFNRALTYERMALFHEAANDWEHYLKVDPKGDWAEEAKRHLDNVRQKLAKHQEMIGLPLLSVTTVAAALKPSQLDTRRSLDSRVEEYLDLILREWLPATFSASQSTQPSTREESQAALNVVSRILATQHQDTWLAELLESPYTPSFSAGIQALAEAARANAVGNPEAALPRALAAELQFETGNDRAGKLRAQLEEIYALHREFRSVECLQRIAAIAPTLRATRYQWIKIQVDLERYACQSSAELRLASTVDFLSHARTAAQTFKYGTLYLRAVGFSAARETEMGLCDRAWEWDNLGLEEYWSGSYPPLRAQQFYDDLSIQAQDSGKWFLAVALGREAVAAITASPNRTGEAMERLRLARSAMQAQIWPEATEQYSQALRMFESFDADRANKIFRANAEIGLAQAELQEDRIESAEQRLQYARSNLPPDFQEYQTWLSLYSAMAEFRQRTGDPAGAENACAAVVLIAEVGLQGIHNELERLRWNQVAAPCYKRVVNWTLGQGNTVAALELWEWYLSSGIRTPFYRPHSNDFSGLDIQPVLPSPKEVGSRLAYLGRETVITYADLQDRVVAWLYDNRGVIWRPLGIKPSQLKRLVSLFSKQCSDPRSNLSDLLANSRALYDLLIEPFSSNLDSKRTLVIEADGEFQEIPFAALSDRNGRFLIDSTPVVYLPSAEYRRRLRAGATISRDDPALVVGNPLIPESDRASYRNLTDASWEAEQVAKEFTRSVLVTGVQATATMLLDNLRDASVFHFAGHTKLQPGRSALLLAMEGGNPSFIDSDNLVVGQMPHLRLAVLSACATDRDSSDSSGGADTIARAFLRNGVPWIVATRWQVDSAATSASIGVFYREALRGRSIPAALAVAMREAKRLPGYLHPYYWAAFDVFGRSGDTT